MKFIVVSRQFFCLEDLKWKKRGIVRNSQGILVDGKYKDLICLLIKVNKRFILSTDQTVKNGCHICLKQIEKREDDLKLFRKILRHSVTDNSFWKNVMLEYSPEEGIEIILKGYSMDQVEKVTKQWKEFLFREYETVFDIPFKEKKVS